MLIENIALHQPAWQSSTVLPYTGAERAVDGLYSNLSVHGRQCAVSDNNHTTAEWRVDLGRVHSIHHVFLQFMTLNRVWGTVSHYTITYCGIISVCGGLMFVDFVGPYLFLYTEKKLRFISVKNPRYLLTYNNWNNFSHFLFKFFNFQLIN